jgi:hypothetical protein
MSNPAHPSLGFSPNIRSNSSAALCEHISPDGGDPDHPFSARIAF